MMGGSSIACPQQRGELLTEGAIKGGGDQLSLIPDHPNIDANLEWVPLDRFPDPELLGLPKPEKPLVDSIRMFGIRQPVAACQPPMAPDPDADIQLIGGRRRIQAAWICHQEWLEKEKKEHGVILDNDASPYWLVPSMVGTDPDGMAILDVQLNASARPNEFAYMDRIRDLIAGGLSLEQVAKTTGLPKGTVERIWNVKVNLSPNLLKAAREGKMRFTTAERAAKLSPYQQRSVLEGVLEANGKVTQRDVQEARQAYHQQFSGVDLGMDHMPGFDVVEQNRQAAEEGEQKILEASSYLEERISSIRSRKRAPEWTRKDQEAVEALLRAL
jgi:transcriptional regulator with XRE-family HTH domain